MIKKPISLTYDTYKQLYDVMLELLTVQKMPERYINPCT